MKFTITRDKGGVIAWTPEQVAYIIDEYTNKNTTLKELGKQFGCSYGTIRNCLNKHGIKSRGNKQGYPRNELYFNQINTKEKAYWLGFLYADGCVHSNNYEISVNITDKEHVEKFQKALGALQHKITETQDKRFEKAKTLYQFSIKDEQLHKDLVKWGCVPQKTKILSKIPNIPKDYVSHFIRGYFDGDGSLHWLKGTNNYRISFTSGSKSFLEEILKELQFSNLSIQKSNNEAYYIQISGRHQVISVLNYMYKDSTDDIRLLRKYNLYLDCLEWAHRH